MGTAYESIICKGCGNRIRIRELEWVGDRAAYSKRAKFNVDVPCEACRETYSYRTGDIQLVDMAGA